MKKIKTYFTNLPIGVKWILALNIIVYLIFVLIESFFYVSPQDYFGAYPTYSENFNPLTVLTSLFVHTSSADHVIINMIVMLIFAPFVEKVIGSKMFILSYFIMGIMGYISVNYSYHENKKTISELFTKQGLDIKNVNVVNGNVGYNSTFSLNQKQKECVLKSNHIFSKTYGASGAIYGMVVLYILFNMFNIKKIIPLTIGIYFIYITLSSVLDEVTILNGSEYAHFGGILGGLLIYGYHKLKKGVI